MSRSPRWTVEGRDWSNRAHSRFVEAGRLRWHVQTMGEGPPLLLLHGTGAATHSWRALMPILAERFAVVAVDLPGHGFTTGRPSAGLSMTAMAGAVGELLRTLAVQPEIIVGHSAGVAIAARMSLDTIATPRAIIGLNAALMPFPGLAARLFPTLAKLLFVNPFAPHIFAGMARGSGETARFLQRSTGSTIDAAGIAAYERLLTTPGHVAGAIGMMADWDLDALARDLPRLAVPLLLIHGEGDTAIAVADARRAVATVTDGRLVTLAQLGHLAHEESPREIADLIFDFVKAA